MADILYRLVEWLDGEHGQGYKVISYPLAEKIKWTLLKYVK
ncbi:MAG: hypothetical protein AAB649_00300 [Patescibacteria group bacterium]